MPESLYYLHQAMKMQMNNGNNEAYKVYVKLID